MSIFLKRIELISLFQSKLHPKDGWTLSRYTSTSYEIPCDTCIKISGDTTFVLITVKAVMATNPNRLKNQFLSDHFFQKLSHFSFARLHHMRAVKRLQENAHTHRNDNDEPRMNDVNWLEIDCRCILKHLVFLLNLVVCLSGWCSSRRSQCSVLCALGVYWVSPNMNKNRIIRLFFGFWTTKACLHTKW